MIGKLEHIIARIEDGTLLGSSLFDDLDVFAALDSRDRSDFDAQWVRVASDVKSLANEFPVAQDDAELVDRIRERAFLTVYSHTCNPDLCGYVSDDFGLIAEAIVLSYQDTWLNGLWLAYKKGVFPHGEIERVSGRLEELID